MARKWPLGVPKHVFYPFYTSICDLDRFLKNRFFWIFDFKKIFFSHIYVKIWNFRLNIGRITSAVNLLTLKLFPKNFAENNSAPLIFATSLCEKVRFWLFCGIRQSVAFVVFVAFWGTTMLFFKKFKIRAFRKVYGLWGYSLPIKTYVRLKFG